MERIPILRMGEFLLVTIQVDMHDQLALRLQDDLSNAIQNTRPRAYSSTSPRSKWSTPSSAAWSPTSPAWENPRRGDRAGRHAACGSDHLVELGLACPV
jgi:hypothetical protein